MKFREWLISEKQDIFGFDDSSPREDAKRLVDENPISPIDSETIMLELVKLQLNGKKPIWDWHDTVEWGRENPGAIRVEVSPLGSAKIITRRLTVNLLGERVWVCKKIIPFRDEHKNNELELAHNVSESLMLIDKELLDTPKAEFPDFHKLVALTNQGCRKYAPDIFVYEGLRKITDNHFIIHMGYRGQGVEAPGHRRCEEFNIDIHHDQQTGMIRSFGYEVSSPVGGHRWDVNPSEWNEQFAPSQPIDEIVQQIVAALTSY